MLLLSMAVWMIAVIVVAGILSKVWVGPGWMRFWLIVTFIWAGNLETMRRA